MSDAIARRELRTTIRTWEDNDTASAEREARLRENAAQRKFHDDSIREIIMDNLVYQINKRSNDNNDLGAIMKELANKESDLYHEILTITIQRTERTVLLKDIATQRKINNGEEHRLINPKKDSLSKRIIRQFNLIVEALVLDYNKRASNNTAKTQNENVDEEVR